MKRKSLLLILLIIAALLLIATVAYAQGVFDLPWWTADSGGGASQGGVFTLSGAIGQPDAARSQGGSYTLYGGFWSGGGKIVYKILLPITQK